MVVPHVEAYGRYLDATLQNEEGPFGFLVFPSPDPRKLRAANEFLQQFLKVIAGKTGTESTMLFYYGLSPYIEVLADGLRELHDRGRRVHLQPHLENFYLVEGIPYVVDWTTMRRLGENAEENILNRAIDLKRSTDDYGNLFSKIFPHAPEDIKIRMSVSIEELAMEIYSGDLEKEISLLSIAEKHGPIGLTEFDTIVLWMKDEGIEGYSRITPAQLFEKVGRNEPCPCGSGKKFKKCHGGIRRDGATM